MRIAIFTDSSIDYLDGVARILQELVAYVNRNTSDTVLVFHRDLTAPHALEPKIVDRGPRARSMGYRAPCIRVPKYGAYPLYYLRTPRRRILRAVREFRPDVLLTVTPYIPRGIGRSAIFVSKKMGIPVIGSFDLQISWNSEYYIREITRVAAISKLLRWWVDRQMRFYPACARILAPSRAMQEFISEAFPSVPVVMFPRAVDIEIFNPKHRSESFLRDVGLQGKTVILFVGRLALEKNLRSLAAAYRTLKEKHPSAALLMVGEGPEQAWYESNGYDDVVFTGPLYGEQLWQAYASADIFAFPSQAEAGPMVIPEALASGLPAIVPSSGGAPDCVENGVSGFVVDDMAEFAERLDELLSDPGLRRSMSQQARSSAEARTWERTLEPIVKLFGEVAASAEAMPAEPKS